MKSKQICLLTVTYFACIVLTSCENVENQKTRETHVNNKLFPKRFQFGAATSSYQIEGAWNESGKSPSIWDHYSQNYPDQIKDGSNGNIACDSYNKIDEDIANLKLLNVDFYRFSINWPRLLPNGGDNFINPDGVRYYNELIDKLIANDIEPMITIYHWELPQCIQDLGGWTNNIVINYFEQFARVCFDNFGDRVKTWITINEPMSVCGYSYEDQFAAPFIHSEGIGSYLCGRNLLLAHATAYHIYNNEYKEKQGGEIGFTIETPWYEPVTDSNDDIKAAERAFALHFGWFAHPVYSQHGDYPQVMRERIDDYSRQQGYKQSRLPSFTPEEVEFIKGTADFLGLNHYTSYLIAAEPNQTPDVSPSFKNDLGVILTQDPIWNLTAREEWTVYPHGLRLVLNYLKDNYSNPKVFITENGYAGYSDEKLNDYERIWYLEGYLASVLAAVNLDGCNVQSYTAWSFMDNFEWTDGYTLRFGMFYVDFTNPARPRTPKKSAYAYKKIIESRQV